MDAKVPWQNRKHQKDGLAFDSEIDLVDDLTERAIAWRKARSKIAAVQSLESLICGSKTPSSRTRTLLHCQGRNQLLLTGRFVVPNYNKWLKEQRETDLKDPKRTRCAKKKYVHNMLATNKT